MQFKTLNYFKVWIVLGALLFATSIDCQSSKDRQDAFRNDFGVNATTLLGNLFSLNTNDLGVPYLVSYRRHNTNIGFRLSLAGNFFNRQGVFNNTNNSFVNLRLGIEKLKMFSDRIQFSYGLDILADYEYENSFIIFQNDFFNQEDRVAQAGIGPSARFHFYLNPRISFYTESSLYFRVGQSSSTFNSPMIPDQEDNLISLSFAVPQALFIAISF